MRGGIYDFEGRVECYRRLIAKLPNGQMAVRFLDHLGSLGLSQAALSNYASHLVVILRLMDFDPARATRSDVERVVAAINRNRLWREATKHHKRVVLRKLIQYAKYGSCDKTNPLPPEVSWIKLARQDKGSRMTPEKFPGASVKLGDKTILVLSSGRLVCVGSKSLMEASQTIYQFKQMLASMR
ncbi:MAG: hypothetical protein NZ952_01900 [Candidatus Bathyarchaeota archaeon]|nr:hypothetical protein [Candidatus Bathyarchaeota archaeon]